MNFNELGIDNKVIEAIDYTEPTEIQEKTIPLVLEGKDVLAQSATGSGKTFVFSVAVIKQVKKRQGLQSLILTPTRELAQQVSDGLRKYAKNHDLKILSVYGGVSINPQISDLRFAEVVVGTPGRILDHIERRTIDFSKLKILVLDEADRMFDMGFIDDIRNIIKFCPKERQTLLFSATLSSEVMQLASRYMINPIRVDAQHLVDSSLLQQVYYDVMDNMKFSLLVHLIKNSEKEPSMVFCNTQRMTDFVERNLKKQGIDAIAIHGGLSQNRRSEALSQFYKMHNSVLVCTDVASRGLDISGVTRVYNYDSPNDSKEYTHRIGRTARAGKTGIAINLISSRDHDNFNNILRHTEHEVAKVPIGDFPRVHFERPQNNNRRRFNYRR